MPCSILPGPFFACKVLIPFCFTSCTLLGSALSHVMYSEDMRSCSSSEYITCDSAEPRSVQDLKRNGIKALPAKKGPGSIEHGIKWIQGHKIVVDNSCVETIKELSTYKYKEDKDGNVIAKPVDANNHLLDALRYALESEMIQNKPTVKLFKHGF